MIPRDSVFNNANNLIKTRNPVRVLVNVLPPELSPERAAALLKEYRTQEGEDTGNSLPAWYVDQIIAALEIVTAGTAVRR